MSPAEDFELLFSLEKDGEELKVTDPVGNTRTVIPPWKVDNQFWRAHHFYDRLTRDPVTDADRAELFQRATTLGSLLFGVLFDEEGRERLRQAMIPGRPRPLITIRSEDDVLLSLPWELLYQDGSFLLKDARMDLARSIPGETALREPDSHLKLVVNVSAPEGSGLDYEGESYRVTKALTEQCRFAPTELGTVEDLVETVRVEKPTAIHFSGHGDPAALVFEDDEGRKDVVPIHDFFLKLKTRIDGPLPPLFYLASCHGNDAGGSKAETSAACLHREGVTQVVGYDGPIVDELSTRAEVAFYRALAEGGTTRHAVRQAREALAAPLGKDLFPFAWAQLVLYHRGPEHPLSLPSTHEVRESEEALRRTFIGAGDRRILSTGFIGRRSEMHEVRRRIRRGDRVFVFQGLGGLGKSTLAFHILPMLQREEGEVLALWCQEVEQQADRLEGLVGQLLDHCRKRFGLDWEQVVHQVDRTAGDDPLQRFSMFLQVLLQNVPRLVLYLDNLESLQLGPKDLEAEGDAEAIGEWASDDLGRLWELLTALAQQADNFCVVASCRYRNPAFGDALLPVSPLPPDALVRLMDWFPSLRRLSFASQVLLGQRLEGHPRAIEYADDLVAHAFAEYEGNGSLAWEWTTLMESVLPKVRNKLQANLLLIEIWERTFTERERRMLFRMTLLRQPWEWPLMAVLGEEGEGDGQTFVTAERLRRTSLLEEMDLSIRRVMDGDFAPVRHFTLHPATVQFVRMRFGKEDGLRRAAHRRLGDHLEAEANTTHVLGTILAAGHHLFQAGEHNRAYEQLGPASSWLQVHGQVREGLYILRPFLGEDVRKALAPGNVQDLLSGLGLLYAALGDSGAALGYYEQQLAVAHENGDRQGEGVALGNLASAYGQLAEYEKAIEYCEQRLAIAHESGDRRGESSALGNLGAAYLYLGELEKSIAYSERRLEIDRELGERRREGNAHSNLGTAYRHLNQFEKAIKHYTQHLEIAREVEDLMGEGTALSNMGVAYTQLGRLNQAIACQERALIIARQVGNRSVESSALGDLGVIYKALREFEKAIGYFERTLVIHREIGDRQGVGKDLANLGFAYAGLGENERAIELLDQALVIAQAIKDPWMMQDYSTALDNLRSNS
ncbi:MAG TPA: tetratricopeptide repeat protein [Thermoanaerobaculia bacterium]|nr:tetratricopeptide repeat protein [Thermoanaerobaculia bacterium]